MLEIAGLTLSGISFAKDLFLLHRDLKTWDRQDLEVDSDWLPLAIADGILTGKPEDYSYSALRRVPTRELSGTHEMVFAHDDKAKKLYRIVQGPPHDRLVLMRKTNPENRQ